MVAVTAAVLASTGANAHRLLRRSSPSQLYEKAGFTRVEFALHFVSTPVADGNHAVAPTQQSLVTEISGSGEISFSILEPAQPISAAFWQSSIVGQTNGMPAVHR